MPPTAVFQVGDPAGRVHGRVRDHDGFGLGVIVAADEPRDLFLVQEGHLHPGDDVQAVQVDGPDTGIGKELFQQQGHVPGIAGGHRHATDAQEMEGRDEGQGSAGDGDSQEVGNRPDLIPGPFQSVDEAAAGAGPHGGVHLLGSQITGALQEPLHVSRGQTGVLAVGVLRDGGVDDLHPHLGADHGSHARVVVFRRMERVQDSDACGLISHETWQRLSPPGPASTTPASAPEPPWPGRRRSWRESRRRRRGRRGAPVQRS